MRRRVLLIAAFAAFATLVIGAPVAVADEIVLHPSHDGTNDALHEQCTWTVDKSASDTSLILSIGQESPLVTYTVTIRATCADQHHAANGDHHGVPNPNGETLHPGGTHPLPDHTINECVNIADTYAGGPNQIVCLTDLTNGSKTFTYTRTFGPFSVCGEHDETNVVTVTSRTHGDPHPNSGGVLLASDSATVHINVPCVTGCTLTQGYWKTHADPATKKFDDAWLGLTGGLGRDTLFFGSGQTWIQVFNTPPAGNAYYILAHQYMAARLNVLNGASVPAAVTTAINQATTLFETYSPAQIGALKGSDPLRQQFIALAGTLGSYNEGKIAGGPPHCDE